MPTYELALLLRTMPKVETVNALKRAAGSIFERGGVLRQIENLGQMDTPYKMRSHGIVHKKASYFVFKFDGPPNCLKYLNEEYERDVDVVRRRIFKVEADQTPECTLGEEMKPPPYRLEVQKMIEEGRKKEKKFKYNSGFDYYPFQK
ncbi:probable 28S ribosomal protein S6, mitochondrial [Ischnura elegans]|uniref:probable 28S ribosomal protein S6, mitochondrial n=1 Tax=Ischnura elegans TaxID=197161 RepID=UPI001ED8775C|nr:probable 28S ribosomal protein S6, mitochondrial [Ischnura elegans]